MRKLASIQRIVEITPIAGADRIELATVLGWHVIVTKTDNYKVGDLCIYCEIDSKIPLELLDKVGLYDTVKQKGMLSKSKGDVLKTKKLRGIYSQGLILPLSILPKTNVSEGCDVSDVLGITKYEPNPDNADPVQKPLTTWGKVKNFLGIKTKTNRSNGFPSFFPKTDETRIQNLGHMLPKLHGHMVYVTEKADGCLDESTVILTEDGEMTIKAICEGKYTGRVYSYNIESKETELCNITNHSILNSKNNWYKLEIETGEKLIVTGNHYIYLPDLNCYRKVEDLVNGEEILLFS